MHVAIINQRKKHQQDHAKKKNSKKQTVFLKTLHSKLKTKHLGPNKKTRVVSCACIQGEEQTHPRAKVDSTVIFIASYSVATVYMRFS